MNAHRVPLLCLIDLPAEAVSALRERYELLRPEDGVPDSCRGIITGYGGKVDATLLARYPNIEIIACFTSGRDMVDTEAASRKGIDVVSNGAALAGSVADLAVALMLASARELPALDAHVRSGRWRERRYRPGILLSGQRLGVAGYGAIGQGIIRRAMAFGMEVATFTRRPPHDNFVRHFSDLKTMTTWANWLVLALPGDPSTDGIVNEDVLKALGPEGTLINIGRGSLVDEAALIRMLETGGIRGAALDVFEDEPTPNPAFAKLANVILSPHQGANTSAALSLRSKALREMLDDKFQDAAGKQNC
ncbi:NAD(P)-dependent oxidoreductase [Martelella mediterranea]|uniref:NAD(P)-dependent oxidoreductase n=1 Tax=Martelella mediterranea TaxID=293089 RepID=UPI0022A99F0F|nr:NAD(P)-dependent oxidoreductase [Martelella mediterranea]